jgi:hypothetical protein
MACDSTTLETLTHTDGMPKLSTRELLMCLAYLSSSQTATAGETLIATYKLAQLSERDLWIVFLWLVSAGADASTAIVLAENTDKLSSMPSRDLLEAMDASGLPSGTAATLIVSAMGAGLDSMSLRDLLALCVAGIATGSASAMLASAVASGYYKLSQEQILECVEAYICSNGLGNLIPGGSGYGGTKEFDLVVQANSSYLIIWGANDLSMTLCGVSYPSNGIGQSTVVATGACTLMQFFGTFANTSVTLRLIKLPGGGLTTPTGFTWVISGANAVATWNAPPNGADGTELWTSADGITWALATTTFQPGVTSSVTAPGLGSVLYGKVRFENKVFPGVGPFTSPLVVSGNASDWAARVVVNGGAVPSDATIVALANFSSSMMSAGLWSKMIAMNVVAPDNLIASRTPFIVGPGLDPWTNVGSSNVLAADVTVYGMQFRGAQALSSGVAGNSMLSTSGGITVLASAVDLTSASGPIDFGYEDTVPQTYCYVAARSTGNGAHQGANFSSNNVINGTGIQTAGYLSLNRTGALTEALYYASPDIAHSLIGSNAGGQTQAPSASLLYMGAAQSTGSISNYTKNTISFSAIHQGLSITESSTFASLIFTLRAALGGGTGSYGDAAAAYWTARVLSSGGALPGSTSSAAISTFVDALNTAGILSKMVSACAFAPDNLIAAVTPCIYKLTGGSNTYTNHNFLLADLTVNGLIGNAVNKSLDTNIIPSTMMSGSNCGVSVYAFVASATGASAGAGSEANANLFILDAKFSNSHALAYNGLIGNVVDVAVSPGAGYYSNDRLTTTDHKLYFANSSNAHAQIGATDATNYAGAGTSVAVSLFVANLSGVLTSFSSDRISFAALHTGLTQAESLSLFNAVVAMRTALGGGVV